ncbi:coniferyl aldehyde dehydrogenase [Ruegeria sp. Alg231-54]|uniref:coniferyl aldehyde dehydrogenase n=1 Tax=Ruegeria sp. Alg231-54 TaxID=1922221 RepID=UPI0018FFE4FE|nr:coniferyl aldehyde dehydrogenase [Ruegeria sp. Alg231-54]
MNQHSPNPAESLATLLETQKAHQAEHGAPNAAERKDRITRLIDLVLDNRDALIDAISADFGNRSHHETVAADIAGTVKQLKFARGNLDRWMRPEKAKVEFPLGLLGARGRIHYQPLGVIGIVSPWNFPIYLAIGPMAEAFAAGNSVMLKPSECTPRTSDLLKSLIEANFAPHEAVVVTGGVEVAQAFTALPFDHLLFTGASTIGPHVLRAAAEHMVPTTLELGGKNPAIIAPSTDMNLAVARIAAGKGFNAGQVCLAPDYVLVPRAKMEEFATQLAAKLAEAFPTLSGNPDVTHIVTDRQFDRLKGLVEQARSAGARVVQVNPANEDLSATNEKILPPTLIVDADPALDVMQDEIFGPILPILPYDSLDQAISFANARPRPLAVYVFAKDAGEQEQVMEGTVSGGACINETIMHSTQNTLPFGGVGNSGMGAYHGLHGFKRFSHAKAIFKQINMDGVFKALRPPYGEKFFKTMAPFLKK